MVSSAVVDAPDRVGPQDGGAMPGVPRQRGRRDSAAGSAEREGYSVIDAWHFMADKDGAPILRDGRSISEGETLVHDGPLAMCESGLHASEHLIDALMDAPGPWLARVRCGGETLMGSSKLVCRERAVLWMLDATRVLHLFACDVAEKSLWDHGVTDKRCWAATAAKRRWLFGYATDKDLGAARDAAWDAARAAARAAAWAAAWDAARAAAWDASNALLTQRAEEERRLS